MRRRDGEPEAVGVIAKRVMRDLARKRQKKRKNRLRPWSPSAQEIEEMKIAEKRAMDKLLEGHICNDPYCLLCHTCNDPHCLLCGRNG